ncbi:MAG: hypothetical protein H6907_13895 [Hyphomicrobiales bacterium]|nr:hypothetical protein [Hyphomicrobiales bacterium]MCP5372815.1 hypothetical protein [Hyphomicrobiales bacterium]
MGTLMPLRGIARAAAAMLLLFAAACQTVSLDSARDHKPGNGIVAFKFVTNSYLTVIFQDHWTWATIADEAGKSFTFTAVTEGMTRSALYVGSVPPGRYHFTGFEGKLAFASAKPNERLGNFLVEAGRVTFLGTLIEHANQDRFVLPGVNSRTYLLYDPKPSPDGLTAVLNILFPGLQGVDLDPVTFIGWDRRRAPVALNLGAFDFVRRSSRGLIDPVELADGSIAFGSVLGQLRLWHPDRGWRNLDVGLNRGIEAFAELPSGAWLVGGEMGMLRRSFDHGASWHDVKSDLPYGVVHDLNVLDGGTVYLTHYRGTEFALYRAAGDLGHWERVQSATFEPAGRTWGSAVQGLTTRVHGGHLYTTLPHSRLAVFDPATRRSTLHDMPGPLMSPLRIAPDGVMRGTFAVFVAHNPYLSRDGGGSWHGANITRYAHMPGFRDKSFGMAIGVPSLTQRRSSVLVTRDGGTTWSEAAAAPHVGLRWIGFSNRAGVAFATDDISRLYYSRDEGRTWTEDSVPPPGAPAPKPASQSAALFPRR